MTAPERKRKARKLEQEARLSHIAILDFETDPFENGQSIGDDGERVFDPSVQTMVKPFLCVLYSDKFEPIIIWDEDHDSFIQRVMSAIEGLPGAFTIYAHNGGKFDYMFLVSRLRGRVSFKGRGIMCARVGRHELRDSFHIIPEKLANWQKDVFDYRKLKRANRETYRDEIIRYCLNDCRYLFEIVTRFLGDFGLKISIGQAAMAELRKHYKVKQLKANDDAFLRFYFYGGRVECLIGRGHFVARRRDRLRLYDVNSMYPFVMAHYLHPIGQCFPRRGDPNDDTLFIDLNCRNHGALIGKTEEGETTATIEHGRFKTTIWEYNMALKYGLIDNVRVNFCMDCTERSNFSEFVLPLYDKRQLVKQALKLQPPGTREYNDLKKDDIFLKLILNNAYGKFAQNPRKFKEYYITDPGERPPEDTEVALKHECEGEGCEYCARFRWPDMPAERSPTHYVWRRPLPRQHFNNVGTAASITGAARAVLMEALQHAINPLYCDTDSIVCEALNMELHDSKLGAWKLEKEFDEIRIAGKKLYATRSRHNDETSVKSKGTAGLSWDDMGALLNGSVIKIVNKGSTLNRAGEQYYIEREIRATTKRR